MNAEQKQKRHEAIVQTTYELLAKNGYDGISMLSIAKAAHSSNETLYRWYGDKQGLFARMVEDNADNMKTLLEAAIENPNEPREALKEFSIIFLETILGERAILLNRVAAADPSGALGQSISTKGRDVIEPLISKLMVQVGAGSSSLDATQLYVSLLVGDLQIKRAIGVLPVLTQNQIQERCHAGLSIFFSIVEPN